MSTGVGTNDKSGTPGRSSLDEATAAYRAFVAPGTGFGVSAALDVAGLEQVIALRGRYGAGNPAPATTEQYDPQWYDRARALVG